MSEKELIVEVLNQILQSTLTIEKRFRVIKTPEDFLRDDRRLEKLDAICMQLIALGESLKNLDKITKKELLKKYPQFEWKKVYPVK